MSDNSDILVKVENKTKKCVVCKRSFKTKTFTRGDGKKFDLDSNLGACNRPRCVLQRMRETM